MPGLGASKFAEELESPSKFAEGFESPIMDSKAEEAEGEHDNSSAALASVWEPSPSASLTFKLFLVVFPKKNRIADGWLLNS